MRPRQGDRFGLRGSVALTFIVDGREQTRTIDLESPWESKQEAWSELGDARPRPWLMSSLSAFSEYVFLNQDWDFYHENRTAVKLRDHTADDLRGLRRVLGKQYESLSTYYFDPDDDAGECPLMRGTLDGAEITNADMSHGELWAHYMLSYALRFEQTGPVLLDEPETLIASANHRALADELSRLAVRQQVQLIVATHSPDIIGRFGAENLLLMTRSSDGFILEPPSSLEVAYDYLAVPRSIQSIVLVEDALAARLVAELASLLGWRWPSTCEVVAVGDAAAVKFMADRLGPGLRGMECLGVVDGDQRLSLSAPHAWIACLPGTRGPEDELLAAARQRPASVASRLDRSAGEVRIGLDSVSALDHQYLLQALARTLNASEHALLRALCECWLEDEDIAVQASELMTRIDRHVREDR